MVTRPIRLIQRQHNKWNALKKKKKGMVLLLQPKLEQLGFLGGEGRGTKKEKRRTESDVRIFKLLLI